MAAGELRNEEDVGKGEVRGRRRRRRRRVERDGA